MLVCPAVPAHFPVPSVTAEPSEFTQGQAGTREESCTFRLAKALFTRAPRRSHEDWNTHRQPSGSVMDINLMRRVKKQQLTEQAESQTDWLTIGEVPSLIRKSNRDFNKGPL